LRIVVSWDAPFYGKIYFFRAPFGRSVSFPRKKGTLFQKVVIARQGAK
jgi:hypothetical protein